MVGGRILNNPNFLTELDCWIPHELYNVIIATIGAISQSNQNKRRIIKYVRFGWKKLHIHSNRNGITQHLLTSRFSVQGDDTRVDDELNKNTRHVGDLKFHHRHEATKRAHIAAIIPEQNDFGPKTTTRVDIKFIEMCMYCVLLPA